MLNKTSFNSSSSSLTSNLLNRSQIGGDSATHFYLESRGDGDGCLDVYWHADMTRSELSRETPHHNLPVVQEVFRRAQQEM